MGCGYGEKRFKLNFIHHNIEGSPKLVYDDLVFGFDLGKGVNVS